MKQLKYLHRQTIVDDHGKDYLKAIPKYDDFVNFPDNLNGKEVVDMCYNLFHPFPHKPKKGSIEWTTVMMEHIFGEQIDLGWDYIQLIYEQPTQVLPILCLVSRENATGKTTFINWLAKFFYRNVAIVGNQDIHSSFNSHYATKLVIAVDESRIDKTSSLEKIKAMATQRQVIINGKYQQPYTADFFGKLILLSNYEDNFINARDEDIRYWVRKLDFPKTVNVNIDADLEDEIPALVQWLRNRKLSSEKVSRMWFDPADLETEALNRIRQNSKSWLYKELSELFEDTFHNNPHLERLQLTPIDIKRHWFANNAKVETAYIRRVIKDEFRLTPTASPIRYECPELDVMSKVGRVFNFTRAEFTKTDEVIDANPDIPSIIRNEPLPF